MNGWTHPHELARRASVGKLVVGMVFGVLAVAFFRVQVVNSQRYALESEDNRLREVSLPAPRGLIVDRHGSVLAENVPGYSVSLVASSVDSLSAMVDRLAPILSLTSKERDDIFDRYRLGSHPDPARSDHHRKLFDQSPDHLE